MDIYVSITVYHSKVTNAKIKPPEYTSGEGWEKGTKEKYNEL